MFCTETFISTLGALLIRIDTTRLIIYSLINDIQIHSMYDFQGGHCDTVHYLVVGKLREKLAVSKGGTEFSCGKI